MTEKVLQNDAEFQALQQKHDDIFDLKQQSITNWKMNDSSQDLEDIIAFDQQEQQIKEDLRALIKTKAPEIEANDKDYVFIYYILNYLPSGVVGLLIAVILSAAMSSTSSELNALATTSVVDIYKRNFAPNISGRKYLNASRWFTLFWGLVAIFFAVNASLFENLIQAVNIIGSLFYGTILGVFAIAFLLPRIGGKATVWSIVIVEPIIILLYFLNRSDVIDLEYLWLNPIGCLLMILVASLLQVGLGGYRKKTNK